MFSDFLGLSFEELFRQEDEAYKIWDKAQVRKDRLFLQKDRAFYRYKTERGYALWLERRFGPELNRIQKDIDRAYHRWKSLEQKREEE